MINASNRPCKSFHHAYLEDLALSIDHVAVENKHLCIMGDFNICYLTLNEQQKLNTVWLHFGLSVSETEEPTSVKGQSGSYIDYIILDSFDCDSFTLFVTDTPRRTSKISKRTGWLSSYICSDHYREWIIVWFTYQKNYFMSLVLTSDWSSFCAQNSPEGCSVFFRQVRKTLSRSRSSKRRCLYAMMKVT